MFGLGPMEMAIIGVLAVLLFGKRLPEVGRSLGKGLVEFKKGLHGIQEEMHSAVNLNPSPRRSTYHEIDDHEEATAPKFEPPAAEPQDESLSPATALASDEKDAPSQS